MLRLGQGRPRSVPVDWQKIRALRGDRSKDEFAELSQIAVRTLDYAEAHGACLSERLVTRIAAALGVSSDEIRGRVVTPSPPGLAAGALAPRRLRLEETTSLGLGSSLSAAVVNDSGGGFDDF